MGCAMRLAYVFNQRNPMPFKFGQQLIRQAVEPLHMGEKHRPGSVVDQGYHLRGVHRERMPVDVRKHRREAVLQHRGNVRNPGQRRHNDFTALRMADFQNRHRQQIGRRTGIDEDAVLDAKPLRPLRLKRAHIGAMRENRIILLQMLDDGIEVFAQDVIAHEGEFHLTFRRSSRRAPPRWCCGHRHAAAPVHRRETHRPAHRGGSPRWWCTSPGSRW